MVSPSSLQMLYPTRAEKRHTHRNTCQAAKFGYVAILWTEIISAPQTYKQNTFASAHMQQ